ncbi:Acg family FMN-binding oxidoreductase [Limnohabitans sp.]|uniref:Acg family FMN-binding oxidoreductase n=1 Tax=Limnohabitans sp. TaxID=1907725 RepID=UPI00391C0964
MGGATHRSNGLNSRRSFIRLVGGGAVLAATGSLTGCSAELPEVALQPWRNPDRESDIRRFMLAHALLAPNPHNLQPWMADLREAGRIHLNCDGERLLPETDPFGRQILIGCGAFLELAVIAAAQRGVSAKVELFPNGAPADRELPKGSRVATLVLGEPGSAPADPLFAQIVRRHTRKSAYASDRVLPETLLRSWDETAIRFGLRSGVATGAAAMDPIRRITREAYEIEATTARTWLESARVMRIGPGAIAANPDGISLNSPMVRALHTVGLFDPMEVPVKGTSSLQRVMDRWVPFETASGVRWLASPDNTRGTQVASGRAYVRAHLLATAAGVDMHPLSQALQEFPEMRGPREALHQTLGLTTAGQTLQMLSRVGFATEARGPSPRRSLDALIRT